MFNTYYELICDRCGKSYKFISKDISNAAVVTMFTLKSINKHTEPFISKYLCEDCMRKVEYFINNHKAEMDNAVKDSMEHDALFKI